MRPRGLPAAGIHLQTDPPATAAMTVSGQLFDDQGTTPRADRFSAGAVLLRGKVAPHGAALAEAIRRIGSQARFRHMTTPGGHAMSVATTSCGELGWVSDR